MHETAHTLVCAVCRGAVSQKCSPVNEWTELGVHSYYLMAGEGFCAASILPAEWESPLFWATVLLICSVLWSGEHGWFLPLIFQLSVLNCRKSKYPNLTSSHPVFFLWGTPVVEPEDIPFGRPAPFSWYLHFYCPFLGNPLNDTESALAVLSCSVWALGGPMPVFERTSGLHLLQEIKHRVWSRTKS